VFNFPFSLLNPSMASPRNNNNTSSRSNALGFEAQLFKAADKLRSNAHGRFKACCKLMIWMNFATPPVASDFQHAVYS